jgi:hypothetical protein
LLLYSSDFSQTELSRVQEDIRTMRPMISLNDPPDALKKLCDSPDFKWYLIDRINNSGIFWPSPKRFQMEKKRPGNGLAKDRSIRSEIKSSPLLVGYNYLNFIDIFTIIESTYYYSTVGCLNQKLRFELFTKKAEPFLSRPLQYSRKDPQLVFQGNLYCIFALV